MLSFPNGAAVASLRIFSASSLNFPTSLPAILASLVAKSSTALLWVTDNVWTSEGDDKRGMANTKWATASIATRDRRIGGDSCLYRGEFHI